MAETNVPAARPLSPHLQVYRLSLTFVMSGLHRITGFVLYFGTVLFVWWLIAAASGANAYAWFAWAAHSYIGQFVLLGYSWTLIHHTLGGIRHLIWDTGRGFGPSEREWLAVLTIFGSVALTVALWVVGYWTMGWAP